MGTQHTIFLSYFKKLESGTTLKLESGTTLVMSLQDLLWGNLICTSEGSTDLCQQMWL